DRHRHHRSDHADHPDHSDRAGRGASLRRGARAGGTRRRGDRGAGRAAGGGGDRGGAGGVGVRRAAARAAAGAVRGDVGGGVFRLPWPGERRRDGGVGRGRGTGGALEKGGEAAGGGDRTGSGASAGRSGRRGGADREPRRVLAGRGGQRLRQRLCGGQRRRGAAHRRGGGARRGLRAGGAAGGAGDGGALAAEHPQGVPRRSPAQLVPRRLPRPHPAGGGLPGPGRHLHRRHRPPRHPLPLVLRAVPPGGGAGRAGGAGAVAGRALRRGGDAARLPAGRARPAAPALQGGRRLRGRDRPAPEVPLAEEHRRARHRLPAGADHPRPGDQGGTAPRGGDDPEVLAAGRGPPAGGGAEPNAVRAGRGRAGADDDAGGAAGAVGGAGGADGRLVAGGAGLAGGGLADLPALGAEGPAVRRALGGDARLEHGRLRADLRRTGRQLRCLVLRERGRGGGTPDRRRAAGAGDCRGQRRAAGRQDRREAGAGDADLPDDADPALGRDDAVLDQGPGADAAEVRAVWGGPGALGGRRPAVALLPADRQDPGAVRLFPGGADAPRRLRVREAAGGDHLLAEGERAGLRRRAGGGAGAGAAGHRRKEPGDARRRAGTGGPRRRDWLAEVRDAGPGQQQGGRLRPRRGALLRGPRRPLYPVRARPRLPHPGARGGDGRGDRGRLGRARLWGAAARGTGAAAGDRGAAGGDPAGGGGGAAAPDRQLRLRPGEALQRLLPRLPGAARRRADADGAAGADRGGAADAGERAGSARDRGAAGDV
ncbi:MAG: Arginyl-tRNA synthetase, partial [uncultured Thermomicrobiales bacterium]